MGGQDSQRTVLGLVPARGGSKGITRKNIRMLAGKPLIAFTADAARASTQLSRVILSTDDPEIAEAGKAAGLDVPFLRPTEFALDSSPMIEVILHALRWAQAQGEDYAAICLLQPTSPLRSAETIDRCISTLWEREVDSVISVRPVPSEHNPHWVYYETSGGLLKLSSGEAEPIASRQQLPQAFHRDGSIFLARTEAVLRDGSLYGRTTAGVVSPESEAFDLDTEDQWDILDKRLAALRAGGGTASGVRG